MKKKTNRKVVKKKAPKKAAPKLRRVQIGVVGVDSGQLLLCDPCYIGSEWVPESRPVNVARVFMDLDNGSHWACALHNPEAGINRFAHFDEVIPFYGKSANQLIAEGRWEERPRSTPGGASFSYQGCCNATLSKKCAGQLNYRMGHPGVGVVFASGYGDGQYPVYGYYNEDGRIVKVEVLMD